MRARLRALLALIPALGAATRESAAAQADAAEVTDVVVPSQRSHSLAGAPGDLRPTDVVVDVALRDIEVETRMAIGISNETGDVRRARLLAAVPPGTELARLSVEGRDGEVEVELLDPMSARAAWVDLALAAGSPRPVELVDRGAARSAPVPIAPGERVVLLLVLHGKLAQVGPRADYELPRSEVAVDAPTPWVIRGEVEASTPISTVYSPTHALVSERLHAQRLRFDLADGRGAAPGPFRVSYLLEQGAVTATAWAYPDARVTGGVPGGGYFLLLAGLPAEIAAEHRQAIRRELVIVLDTSGSMRGEKLEQAREAALQAFEGLEPGESFNLITYESSVHALFPRPVPKTEENLAAARDFLRDTTASGQTALHDALMEALAQEPVEGHLPLVLFVTDGLPTHGITDERTIREHALERNPHARRVFAIGVGLDVNVPLLDGIAREARGESTYVQPGEDVERAIASVIGRLRGPVLAGTRLELATIPAGGPEVAARHVEPSQLPDLYAGDRLVVLGQYAGPGPLRARLGGSWLGVEQSFALELDLAGASVEHAFVPRLWASRAIGRLVDEVRQAGERAAKSPGLLAGDERTAERVYLLLRLSTEYGVLTEYTAFLALEGTDLANEEQNLSKLRLTLLDRAQRVRVGRAAFNQSLNARARRTQEVLDRLNRYYDTELREVQHAHVRQVHDRAFFRRGETWIDSRLLRPGEAVSIDELVPFGSSRWIEVLGELAVEGRPGLAALDGNVALLAGGRTVFLERPLE